MKSSTAPIAASMARRGPPSLSTSHVETSDAIENDMYSTASAATPFSPTILLMNVCVTLNAKKMQKNMPPSLSTFWITGSFRYFVITELIDHE